MPGPRTSSILIVLAALSLTACGRPIPAPVVYGSKSERTKPTAPAAAIAAGDYRVDADETLYGIARRSGVAMRDLISANGLQPPYRLRRGQSLRIPALRYHRVQSGETLYSISRRYRVSMFDLARANDLTPPHTIRPGQSLKLPASERASQPRAVTAASPPPATAQAPLPGQKPPPGTTAARTRPPKPAARQAKRPPPRTAGRFAWPVQGRVISRFGAKPGGLHNDGINIAVQSGVAVRAADNGVVVYAGNELRGFGNLLLLRHRGGWVTAYGHNQALSVRVGDVVKRGEAIARAGSSGNIEKPQLHFEIRKGRRAVNPLRHLEKRSAWELREKLSHIPLSRS
ncbi:MAG: M23 family metallopeptidase [Alphaproteobacteria bacterium]|jgi:murein DD-endopeptidase MepM/ murein hydrolase activator NlpD|nr:M23 family metallopeptidase [Alphaproteobacteria bacterium]MDP6814071.1 M23 family metallopeptidase [Alphaproteobacteria bacterium]